MAIVRLEKITLYGPRGQREQVLAELQRLGCMHVINLADSPPPGRSDLTECAAAHEALKYLRAYPAPRPQAHSRRNFDPHDVVQDALATKRQVQELMDERDELRKAVERLRPWGNFQLPDAAELGGCRLWFYALRSYQLNVLENREFAWQKIAEDHQFTYLVVISAEEPVGMPTAPLSLDVRPLDALELRLEKIDEELDEHDLHRAALTRWCDLLEDHLAVADDEAERQAAEHQMLADEQLFAIRGWVPRSAADDVRELARRLGLALTLEAPRRDELPPTLLKNPERIAGAEQAVRFYITPPYHTWDPTFVVYLSFSFFFAMIMADAGYGFVLGAILILLWRRLSGTDGGRRFRDFFAFLVLMTIVYGMLIGSYFGLSPPRGSGLDRLVLRLNDQPLMADRNVMMALSVAIGVLHLSLANAITAWRFVGHSRCLGSVGWVGLLLGGLLFAASVMTENPLVGWLAGMTGMGIESFAATLKAVGQTAVVAGGIGVFAFSSPRPLLTTRWQDWLWRAFEGLQALTGLSKAFGDTLSYLRLFALGLASAQLAATFNDMASSAAANRGPGLVLAVLIVVLGHGINFLLGIMGGVVHGLRLNCIEFFNWSLQEEGFPFRAFCKKANQ
jgi:V/A-type H+-transporting ATPase subunit I